MAQNTGITNTIADDPMVKFAVAAFGGIEAQESQGQRELVNSTRLPTDSRDEDELLALGFSFGEPDPHDPMFRDATLPEGWRKEGSDHAMWSYILDERGARRVAVFYKAAFYDRSAFMRLQNVGASLATDALYGEGPVSLPSWLTANELAEVVASADRMDDDIAQYSDIYGKSALRLAALLP